jgi:hypothetical protein
MLENVAPPSALICHCAVTLAGLPAAMNVAGPPAYVVADWGWLATDGGRLTASVADAEVTLPSRPVTTTS